MFISPYIRPVVCVGPPFCAAVRVASEYLSKNTSMNPMALANTLAVGSWRGTSALYRSLHRLLRERN